MVKNTGTEHYTDNITSEQSVNKMTNPSDSHEVSSQVTILKGILHIRI